MTTSAAIYCRISKDTQGKALGVQRQRTLCEQLVTDRGWTVGTVYTDNDLSAYSGKKRPEYEQMLKDIEAGQFQALVTYHPDRLHRQTKELEPFIDMVESVGLQIATVSGGEVDLTTPSGRAVAKTIGAWAQYESEQKAERLKSQKQESAANGWYQGGRRPYGYEPGQD